MTTKNRPKPLWRTLKALNATPSDILTRFGMVTAPVDVELLAELLGVTVHRVPNPGWSGAITVYGDSHAVIWVNMGESPERQRFTIAHELGHLMLHDTTHAFRDVTYDGSETESEANRFAADLLMPLWMVGPLSLNVTSESTLEEMATLFGVSKGAMLRRVHESFGLPVAPL